MNPSKLPRGCSGWPPQLAADRSGTLTRDQSGAGLLPLDGRDVGGPGPEME
jgi:hypothetical protein